MPLDTHESATRVLLSSPLGWTQNALVCAGIFSIAICSSVAADKVTVTDASGEKSLVRKGTIVDFKGATLTLELASGRETKIPTGRVRRIEADWSEPHIAADARYEQHDYRTALNLYRKAFNKEQRAWVKRRLLERVIRCYRNVGKEADACRMFERLVKEDPNTPYLACIPLSWPTKQCPADVKAIVASWLRDDQLALKRLVAASWLLVNNRSQSIAALRDLGRDSSKSINSLAVAQLWRAELLTMKESRLSWWREQLESTPPELRAGSYYLLGESFTKFGQQDEATLAFLRVPTMFPHEVSLGQQCLSSAANIFQSQSHRQEAVNALQMSVELDSSSVRGQAAKALLVELTK